MKFNQPSNEICDFIGFNNLRGKAIHETKKKQKLLMRGAQKNNLKLDSDSAPN